MTWYRDRERIIDAAVKIVRLRKEVADAEKELEAMLEPTAPQPDNKEGGGDGE